jgi:hypothetical protein
MGWVVKATPRTLYPQESEAVPTVQEAGWAAGPVLTGAENLAPNGVRTPGPPTRSAVAIPTRVIIIIIIISYLHISFHRTL